MTMSSSATDCRTILIVDDTPSNLGLLSNLLKDQYQIKVAGNGFKALELALTIMPDMILLDILMPEMDGYQVLRELKASELTRDIPVIFISSLDSAEDEEKGLALGAVDYISKPFFPAIVRARVQNHLSLCAALKLLREQERTMRRHAAILDRHVLVLNMDTAWRITHASEAFCLVAGYTKEQLRGQPLESLNHSDNAPDLLQEIRQVVVREGYWNGALIYRARDGHSIRVEAHIEPMLDARQQNIIGYTTVDHDVSDKKRIEELSVTDHLTRLFNRLKLDEILNYEFARAKRFNSPLSYILLDVDHFKSVNDTWGHQLGDQVLVAVAQTVRLLTREVDISGRWGGEEFAIVSTETDVHGAAILAEKLRIAILDIEVPPVMTITCSFGVAQLQQGEDIEDLIRNADRALYRAKAEGRNRVVVHQK